MGNLKKISTNLVFFIFVAVLILAGAPGRKIAIKKDPTGKPSLLKPYAEGEVLVKFKKGVNLAAVNQIAIQNAMTVKKHFRILSKLKGNEYVLLRSSKTSTLDMVNEFQKNISVEAVSPNYINKLDATPNDTRYSELWGMHNTGQTGGAADADIDAPAAWDINTGSSSVIVAVIDSGLDYRHPDLAANVWVNAAEHAGTAGVDDDGNGYVDDIYGIDPAGYDGAHPDTDPMDGDGHGTHCSGTIGAVGNNSLGVAGVNWNVKIMGLKFFDDAGENGFDSSEIECIEYAIDKKNNYAQNIVAINASFGGAGFNQIEKDAIDAAGTAGIVFCAAAGNDGTDNDTTPFYPSSYDSPSIIAVASTDHNDVIASSSCYGAASVDLGAPGVGILSTVPGVYIPQAGDIFFDNMEGGAGNWLHGGTLDAWAISENQEGFENASYPVPSPTHFWSDSPGVVYSANTDSWLAYGADIDLSSYAGQDIYLGFGSAMYIEGDGYDHGYVELSSNGGSTWTPIFDFGGYSYYWSDYSWFIPESFKTSHFRFRFHITSDDSYQYWGWLIDNIGIGTTVTYGYESWNGTSMATPHVAGAVALLAAEYPAEGVATRINRILANVDANTSLAGKCVTGGRLNLYNAITATVTDTISVTLPNGAENWTVGASQNITWTSTGTIANVQIEYSTTNGSSWNDVIASTANDGSHSWTIPNSPSTTCLVRISDAVNSTTNDVSDAAFTISTVVTPTVTVTSPNGGESWQVGSSQNITWTSTGTIANVMIEYSMNNGSNWTTETASTANDGTYAWSVPNSPSTTCLVKVSDAANAAVTDSSNAVFTISNSISDGNWTQKSPALSPAARHSMAMAYDEARGQVVLFGGNRSSGDLNDTWVWNGSNWTQKSPASSPPARSSHAMAYDEARGQVVLFGGNSSSGDLNDTWVWDGSTWTQKAPASNPPARYIFAMAYDAARGQVVLFGGSGNLNDTWVWDGSNWTQKSPITSPPALFGHAMTYDVAHGQLVLFGGSSGLSGKLNDTWVWDGSNWSQKSPASSPPARSSHTMAFDAAHEQVVLFGGNTTEIMNDTWVWDGSNWTQEFPALSPPKRVYAAMTNYAARGEVVLFGGLGASGFLNDTWVWPSANPGNIITATSPNGGESWTVGSSHDIIWTSTGTIVNVNIDYSTNNGGSWTPVVAGTANDGNYAWTVPSTPSTTCLVRISNAANAATNDVSDAAFTISAVVAPTVTVTDPNGGESWQVGSSQNITWTSTGTIANIMIEYSMNNGSNWTTETASTANDGTYAWSVPNTPSTNCLVKVSDAANAAVTDSSNTVFTISASISHGNWTQKSPATSPPARSKYAMAYDAARKEVVMFGGSNSVVLNDTWVWNGSNWTQKSPVNRPPARSMHAMAYDALHGEVVMFGGNDFRDTWVWNGSDWTQKSPASSPAANFGQCMAYDAARGEVVLFGSGAALTWIWNGSNWHWHSGGLADPDARAFGAMAYDGAHEQVVLFGGGSSIYYGDTWLWGGSSWTAGHPVGWLPVARGGHGLAYDGVLGQVVLFGGIGGSDSGYWNDTWLWDGSNWMQEFPALNPPGRTYTAMVYDDEREETVLFGGWRSGNLNDTWVWVSANPGATITITMPNGGESWTVGSSHDITWASTGTIANVNIDYSTNSGGSWTPVVAGTANDGTYAWTVPNTPSTNCLVRVSDTDDTPSDNSNAVFTIVVLAETVSAPTAPTGPASGATGTSYAYSTGGATSSLGHAVQYLLDWDDGTTSGWLAVGTPQTSHSWSAAGTYDVRAMARCAEHATIESLWSATLSVIITDGGIAGEYNSPAQYKVLPEVIWATASGGGTWMSNVQLTDVSGGSQVSVYYNAASGRRGPFLLWDNSAGGALSSVKYTNLLETIDGLDTETFTYYGTVGAVEFISQDGSHLLQAAARTLNGSYAKTFTALSLHDANTATTSRAMIVANLSNNVTYRSTGGFFNPTSDALTVEFTLLNGSGGQIGSQFNKTLAGHDFQAFNPFIQAGVPYPGSSYDNVILRVRPTTGAGQVMCFGATVDNTSNDPAAHVAVQGATGYDNGPGSQQILPEVIWSSATGGGTWMSNVQVTDVSGGSQVSVYYNAASGRRGPFLLWDNSGGGALSSVKYANLLETIDGLDTEVFTYYGTVGAVEFISQDGSHLLQAAARTLNGNYAKTLSALNLVDAETADTSRVMLIQNYTNNAGYRSTCGFFNPTADAVTVEFTLLNSSGAQIGAPFSKTLVGHDFQAFNPFIQAGVPYPGNAYDNIILRMRPTTGVGSVMCFGATVDNTSNDPAAHLAVQGQ